MRSLQLGRRTILRAGGATVALPVLEAMLDANGEAFADGSGPAKRMVIFFAGMGTACDFSDRPNAFYVPKTAGANYDVTGKIALEDPFTKYGVKDDISLVSGLRMPYGIVDKDTAPPAGGWFGGFHSTAHIPLLSGNRSTGDGNQMGPSADQMVAPAIQRVGQTPLTLRVQPESYYAKGQQYNISFRPGTNPSKGVMVSAMSDPGILWRTLFSAERFAGVSGDKVALANLEKRRLVVDMVRTRAAALKAKLGRKDQMLVDEHLARVSDMQTRLNANPEISAACRRPPEPKVPPLGGVSVNGPGCGDQDFSGNKGWSDETTRGKMVADLLAVAFSCDFARVASLLITEFQCGMSVMHLPGVSDPPYGAVPNGGGADVHTFAHSGAFGGGSRRHALIIRWHVEQFAYFVSLLKYLPDAGGSILNNTAMLMLHEGGHGFMPEDPTRPDVDSTHSTENMVCLVAGRAGGLKAGVHVDLGGGIAGDTRAAAASGKAKPYNHPVNVSLSAMKAVGYEQSGHPLVLGEVKGHIPDLFG